MNFMSVFIFTALVSSMAFASQDSRHFRHAVNLVSAHEFPRSVGGFHSDEPILFKGAAKKWKIMNCISDEQLQEAFGDSLVKVFLGWGEEEGRIHSDSVVTTLSKHMESIRKAMHHSQYVLGRCYQGLNLTVNPLKCAIDGEPNEARRGNPDVERSHICSELEKKAEFPEGLASWDPAVIIWFFGGHSQTIFHNHGANFLAQLRGKKKVYMVKPEEASSLNCTTELSGCLSHVDPENPDYKKHPYFENANVYEAQVDEGDVLFIPTAWYHNVQAVDVPSLSIAYFYPMRGEI